MLGSIVFVRGKKFSKTNLQGKEVNQQAIHLFPVFRLGKNERKNKNSNCFKIEMLYWHMTLYPIRPRRKKNTNKVGMVWSFSLPAWPTSQTGAEWETWRRGGRDQQAKQNIHYRAKRTGWHGQKEALYLTIFCIISYNILWRTIVNPSRLKRIQISRRVSESTKERMEDVSL